MKYLQEGGFQANPAMRATLALTLLLLVGFWITNFAMYFSRMSLRPASVVAYYSGSEQEYRAPRSAASMLETTHAHLPMLALVLLLLTHLALFVPASRSAKLALVYTTFGAALLEEGAGWLVRFVSPAFAPLKVIGFLLLQATIFSLLAALGLFLLHASRQRAERQRPARRPAGAGERRAEAYSLKATPGADLRP